MIDHLVFEARTLDSGKVEEQLRRVRTDLDNGQLVFESRPSKVDKTIVRLIGDRVKIKCNLHKGYNFRTTGAYENASPVGYNGLTDQIQFLQDKYRLDRESSTIKRFEFGINTKINGTVPELLSNVLFFKTTNGQRYPMDLKHHRADPFLLSHKGDGFVFKLYSKGLDNKLEKQIRESVGSNTIRVEFGMSNKEWPHYPRTLNQLCEFDTQINLAKQLRRYLTMLQFRTNYENAIFTQGKPSNIILHIHRRYTEGMEENILRDIENWATDSKKRGYIKKAYEKLLNCYTDDIQRPFIHEELLLAVDREIFNYLGAHFRPDLTDYFGAAALIQ